jgi:hypothetical protein
VRAELGITKAHLLETFQHESKVERLIRDIGQLSDEEKKELFNKLS